MVNAIRQRRSVQRRREAMYGILFASPFLIGFFVFSLFPVIISAFLSFFDYDILSKPLFIGINNYTRAFYEDDLFWPSLVRTFYYVALSVPLGVTGSLLLAWALDRPIAGFRLFRALFYVPSLTPAVALAFLWRWLLNPRLGPINYTIESLLGIQGPNWFGDPNWAIPSLVLMGLWGGIGGNRMLIFLAALQGVPQELYEAAEIDGAGRWDRLVHVTLPIVSPAIFLNLVLSIIGALKVFATAYIATAGGPARATWFIALHIYTNAFKYFDMGYASALAWIFLVIVLAFTLIQFISQKRWVYYAGET